MQANALPVHSRSRHYNSTKYVISCQDRISTTNPTLKPPMQKDMHRVLEGILEKRKKVAIKLSGSQSIYKEYKIAEELREIPGFIRPLCYFECEDYYTEFPSKERTSLCKGPGSSIKVIVLPFFEEGSMRSFNWTKKPASLLHSCLLQLIASLLQAYETKGIIHSDTHLDNVLLKKTKVRDVEYILDGHKINISTEGYFITIMDFEMSMSEIPTNRGRAIGQVYDDILHAVFDLKYNDTSEIVGDIDLVKTLMELKLYPVDIYSAWQTLYPLVLKLHTISKAARSFTYDPYNTAMM